MYLPLYSRKQTFFYTKIKVTTKKDKTEWEYGILKSTEWGGIYKWHQCFWVCNTIVFTGTEKDFQREFQRTICNRKKTSHKSDRGKPCTPCWSDRWLLGGFFFLWERGLCIVYNTRKRRSFEGQFSRLPDKGHKTTFFLLKNVRKNVDFV